MKKVLFFAVAAMAVFGMSSCADGCTCEELETGTTTTVSGVDCDTYEYLLNEEAADQGYYWQDWRCY